jgi:CBS domain-containing protein
MSTTTERLDRKAREFLNSVNVAAIKRSELELICLAPTDTVEFALKKLSENAISSAPVFDANKQQIIGGVSVLDLTAWLIRTYTLARGDHKELDASKLTQEFNKPLQEIIPYGTDPCWPVTEETPLDVLVNCYFKWRIHKAPVVNDKHITGYVSQSDVVSFLSQHQVPLGPIMNKTLDELGLKEGPVLSVSKGLPLVEAFSNILETKFTGLAITDSDGRLFNNISASDLKGLTKETFGVLEKPIEKFIEEKKKLPPVTCTPDKTLGEVIKQLSDCRIHRIFVIDSQNRPTNVITHTTIMKLFSDNSECFV